MKIHVAFRTILLMLAIAVPPSLRSCLTGVPALDNFFSPRVVQELEMEEAIERSDRLVESLRAVPQGEFVPPVAPVAPVMQPLAPQANPPALAPIPGAPVILRTTFPSPIPADGQWHYGWIDFTDGDGDVTTLKIEIMWTTAPVKGPGATRDAEIEGSPTAGKVRMRFT